MRTYTRNFDNYTRKIKEMKQLEDAIMFRIVSMIKTISLKPLHIGNHWFFYMMYEGKEVPSYCHQNDYKEGCEFKPIYDEDNTELFGWSNFSDCCRIFDLIEDRIMNETKIS